MASEFLLSNTLTGTELHASSCLPYLCPLFCQFSLPAPMIMAWQTSSQISFSWADVAMDLSRVSTITRPLTVSLVNYYPSWGTSWYQHRGRNSWINVTKAQIVKYKQNLMSASFLPKHIFIFILNTYIFSHFLHYRTSVSLHFLLWSIPNVYSQKIFCYGNI